MPGGWRNLELQPHSKRVRVRAAQASDARGGATPRAAAAAGPAARDVARGWGAATSRHAALDAQLLVAPAAPLAADHGRAPHAAQARGGGGRGSTPDRVMRRRGTAGRMPVAAPHASARRPLPRCDRTRRAPGAAADPRCGNRAAGTTLPRPPPPSPPPQRKHPLRRRPQRAVVATATTTRGRGCGAPGPGRGGCGLWRDATAAGAPMALPPPPSPPPPPPPPGGQQPDGAHRLLDDALVGALAARGNALHSPRARAILRSILLRGATRGLTRPRARRARNAGAFARDGVEEELAAGVEPRARPPRERERTARHTLRLPLDRALAVSRQRVRGG